MLKCECIDRFDPRLHHGTGVKLIEDLNTDGSAGAFVAAQNLLNGEKSAREFTARCNAKAFQVEAQFSAMSNSTRSILLRPSLPLSTVSMGSSDALLRGGHGLTRPGPGRPMPRLLSSAVMAWPRARPPCDVCGKVAGLVAATSVVLVVCSRVLCGAPGCFRSGQFLLDAFGNEDIVDDRTVFARNEKCEESLAISASASGSVFRRTA